MAKIGVVQMNSGADPTVNFERLKRKAKGLQLQGARLVITPENTLIFGDKSDYQRYAEPLNEGPLQHQVGALCRQLGIWLLLGSMPIRQLDGSITSTSLLFDDKGQCCAHYNKLHMFDVEIADKHHSYRESDIFKAGDQVVVVDTPVGKLGLSICYDLRFPQLYCALRDKGAEIIAVPAAFTRQTGEAHWEVLLRSRAIETQSWLVAAAQWGDHSESRETWGHSMIIDPWGKIMACQSQGRGVLLADIDLSLNHTIRTNMPLVEQARLCVQPRE